MGAVPVRWHSSAAHPVAECEPPVGSSHDLSAVVVDLVVAVAAQQAHVVDVGGAAVLPVPDVVYLAPVGRGAAADAAAVACHQGGALGGAGVAPAAAEPKRLALLVEDGRQDLGVARQPQEFLGRERRAASEAGVGEPPGERVVVDDDEQIDARGCSLGVALTAAVCDQHLEGVGHALLGGTAVLGVLGAPELVGGGRNRDLDAAAADGIEPAEQFEHAVGLLLDGESPLRALTLAALLQVVTAALIEVLADRAAEQVGRLPPGCCQQLALVDRRRR